MNKYISPHSGVAYDVVPVVQERADYAIPGDSTTRFTRQYTEYQFYENGKKVTWTLSLDPSVLEQTFGEIEGVYTRWNASPWD